MAVTEHYAIIDTEEKLDRLVREIEASPVVALDTETTGFDWWEDQLVGWSFCVKEGEAYYIPVRHTRGQNLDPDWVCDKLRDVLENHPKIVIHNAKFDERFLRFAGIHLNKANVHDTLLMTFVAAEGFEQFGLKELEKRIWKIKPIDFNDLFPPRSKDRNIAHVEIAIAGYYAAADADYCLRLHNRYRVKMINNFIYNLEHQLWPVTQQIEEAGAKVDPEFMERQAELVLSEAEKVLELIYGQVELAAGRRIEFSVGSNKQLGEVLYDIMGLPVVLHTPTGAPSTSELALEQLESRYPICRNILTYRSMLSNARSVGTTLTEAIGPDGRIHTQYNQAGATSGRFASSHPNLQNIAKLKKWTVIRPDGSNYSVAVKPRDSFVAPPGKYLAEFDFKAIEFILMAAMSGETGIVEAYLRGDDVHRQTAALVYRVPEDQITPPQRELAKTCNYLIIYGGGAKRLSLESGIPLAEAEAFIERFYQIRPKFLQFQQTTREKAKRSKRVQTHFGRDQLVPEFFEAGRQAASKADRACVNRRIQGTAADIQKLALVRTTKAVAKLGLQEMLCLILQTHDSQTWEIDRSMPPDEIVPKIVEAMSMKLPDLPRILVDVKLGTAWGTLENWKPGMDWEAIFDAQLEARESTLAGMPQIVEQVVQGELDMADRPPARLLFYPRAALDSPSLDTLFDVLSSFPGDNLVVVCTQDGNAQEMSNRKTSLNAITLTAALRPVFPNCTVEVDQASLAAAVFS